jgi:hypothetical protein
MMLHNNFPIHISCPVPGIPLARVCDPTRPVCKSPTCRENIHNSSKFHNPA